jgi:tetratricopeptide (TPR) repeat protein
MSPGCRGAVVGALLSALVVRSTGAQCPDGTPPPCTGWSARPHTTAPPHAARDRARTFLVLPFRNLSHIPQYEWLIQASPTMLADALGQWTEVTVVPDERLYPALRRQGLQAGSVMDLARVQRVGAETGGWTAVTGEVLVVGDRLRVNARAYDLVTQRLVTRTTFEGRASDDVRSAYEHIATVLLRAAGLEQASGDLATATTRSLEAYRAYLRGVAHLNRAEYRQARDALVEAVRIDSTFAQAYAKLAEVSLLAFSVLDPDHPAYGYAQRAATLSNRLPPRAASHVRALRSLLNADFTAARAELVGLVAQDSNDVDALEELASLEFLDPLLVEAPAGERRRGSLNAAARLSRRVLQLDPTRHGAYQGLVVIYSLAGGQLPGAVAGYRRELPRPVRSSVRAWCSCDFELGGRKPDSGSDSVPLLLLAGPDVSLVPLLRDSLELVPLDSLPAIAAESLAAARARARAAAKAWARQWLVAGPAEAEAHRMTARVLELDGNYEAALRELDLADSLGVEAEAEAVAARRMILLGKLGRWDDARRIADSLWGASYFGGELFATVPAMTEAYAWATNLYAAVGDFERVRAALAAFSARLAVRLEPASAYAATVAVLSGSQSGSFAHVVLPDGLRLAVREALGAELARTPGDPLLGAWLRTLSAAFPNR